MLRCLLTEGDFRAVDAVDARIAAGGLMGGFHQHTGNETELHQAMGKGVGKVEALEDGGIALAESGKSPQAASICQGRRGCQILRNCEFTSLLNYLLLILLRFGLISGRVSGQRP